MTVKFIQEGKTFEYTASGADVASGDVVIKNNYVGIAKVDMADGKTGAVLLTGVVELPKAAPLVINQGDLIYWDVADGNINKSASGNTLIGTAWEAALSADETVKVNLNFHGIS